MNYIRLRQALDGFMAFSLNDIRVVDESFHRRRLNEWQDKGYIRKIVRGYYIFSDININENALGEIANKIYNPSYVSCETALAHYGLTPESVYAVVSATTRRTYRFSTAIGEFIYRTVMPRAFFGYRIVQNNGRNYKIADPEKAIIDYCYLNPSVGRQDDFENMRVNKNVFKDIIDRKLLLNYINRIGQESLFRRIEILQGYIDHA